MNLKEAYTTLELAEGTSPEDAKKKYKEAAKKYHPDINKDPDAEAKFKKINEAYQCVQNGKGNDREEPTHYPYGQSPFGNASNIFEIENIEIYLTVDFKESVLGCKKEVKYSRNGKCSACNGNGSIRLNNGCKKCNGQGQATIKRGGMVFVSTCPECRGRANIEECKSCKGEGAVKTEVSIHVSVPAGIIDGNILRLQGMGNYAGSFMGMADQHADVFCHLKVVQEPGLSIENKNVISTLSLSLLEALQGCKHSIKTIYGMKEIDIKPQSKNRDEVIVPHCGVGGTGDHKVILDIKYPKNIDKLLLALIEENNGNISNL